MKVLWVLNTPLPEALSLLNGHPEVSHATGSWVCALAEALGDEEDIQLFTVAPSPLVRNWVEYKGASATHFILSAKQQHWRDVFERVKPDVTHIHGTEYPYFSEFVQACGNEHVVVSLQGLVSEICKHYYGGVPEPVVRRYTSVRDIIRRDSLMRQKNDITRRGESEIHLLQSVNHVIGRTSWDRRVCLGINPALHYHSCNEMLRRAFYSGKWEYSHCIPHRIFLSQGHYPLKGIHTLLEALPSVLSKYPDTQVHIAGTNILRGESLSQKLLRSGYARYLVALMRALQLEDVVRFIGEVDASRMKQELLSANVFASVSAIENSPNSLCEAQMLGVPCIASNVGGTVDLIPEQDCGMMYSFGSKDALARSIVAQFEGSAHFDNTKMRQVAASRHDRQQIIQNMKRIYAEVAN